MFILSPWLLECDPAVLSCHFWITDWLIFVNLVLHEDVLGQSCFEAGDLERMNWKIWVRHCLKWLRQLTLIPIYHPILTKIDVDEKMTYIFLFYVVSDQFTCIV